MKSPITKKQLCLLLFIICTNCGIPIIDNAATFPAHTLFPSIPILQDLYFNTGFLSKYDLVADSLIKSEGFQEVSFNSTDGKKLNGLLRKKENSKYSVIFCAGFYPGRKEGLATFIRLIPEHANVFFFDARGHGKSEGRFFTNFHNYGVDEYRDVIGAIEYVKQQTRKPIIIHGICAGAFHAAKALSQINIEEHNIKGLIFDSGLDSLLESTSIPEKHFKEKVIPNLLLGFYSRDSREQVRKRYLTIMLSSFAGFVMRTLAVVLRPILKKKEEQITLINKINKINCPILYIHAQNDSYCPIERIQALSEKTSQRHYWWVENSEHTLNHLKHTQEYRATINKFLTLLQGQKTL